MKRYTINIGLFLLSFALLVVSCDDALVKSNEDYKPNPNAQLASITLNSVERATDETISLEATVSDWGNSIVLDQGFIISTDTDFENYTVLAVKLEDEDYLSGGIKLTIEDVEIPQGREYHVKAYVLTVDGVAESSDKKAITLPITWVKVSDVEFTDHTFTGKTYPVELQKYHEGKNRFRLVDPFQQKAEKYLNFFLDPETGAATADGITPGVIYPAVSGYNLYWDTRYVGTYCIFENVGNSYYLEFLLLEGTSLFLSDGVTFVWEDGYLW